MNDQMNAPMPAGPAGPSGISEWASTWITAVTKPKEQTFATLAEHPDAMSVNRAFLWIFLAGTISALISGVLSGILGLVGFSSQAMGLGNLIGGAQGGVMGLVISICISPIAGGLAVLGFAIGVGIIQWIAKMFKGTGTFSQLAYTMAAVSVPISLVSSVITPLSAIPFVVFCTLPLSLLILFYSLALEVMAVKAVNKFGWGEAAGSVFLPVLVLGCCAIVPIAVMTTLGQRVNSTFNSINNSLTP